MYKNVLLESVLHTYIYNKNFKQCCQISDSISRSGHALHGLDI